MINNLKGVQFVIEYLINFGYKKIGFLNGYKKVYVS